MTASGRLLREASALLLDFDGPVAALMPPPANAQTADQAREPLAGLTLPPDVASSTDHLAVLRYTLEHQPDHVPAVEAACADAETAAAQTCEPSPHALDLLAFAYDRRIPVALVSNNADRAVRKFIATHDWTQYVEAFACRTPETVDWLKPSPQLVVLAADVLRIDITETVFVGDSASDVTAGKAAGVPVIGLAKHDQRAVDLHEAGAEAVVRLGDRAGLLD